MNLMVEAFRVQYTKPFSPKGSENCIQDKERQQRNEMKFMLISKYQWDIDELPLNLEDIFVAVMKPLETYICGTG